MFIYNVQVELVRREMAWESEKHQIALDKLKQRYYRYTITVNLIIVQ